MPVMSFAETQALRLRSTKLGLHLARYREFQQCSAKPHDLGAMTGKNLFYPECVQKFFTVALRASALTYTLAMENDAIL